MTEVSRTEFLESLSTIKIDFLSQLGYKTALDRKDSGSITRIVLSTDGQHELAVEHCKQLLLSVNTISIGERFIKRVVGPTRYRTLIQHPRIEQSLEEHITYDGRNSEPLR